MRRHRKNVVAAAAAAVLTAACAISVHLAASAAADECAADTTVRTASGPVCGITANSDEEWLGIPYAAPPVGDLRWRSPQPPAPWTGTLDATAFGSICAQGSGATLTGSEDCLFVNVTRPDDGSAGLPVLVHIHSGGFTVGSGNGDYTLLANAAHAVVVSMNYRLGVFGFLAGQAFGDHSGDYGLQDQQAALRWVRDNIAGFGGDPTNVTIYGESAGGSSVCDHLASPTSSGLFTRAISVSGEYNNLLGTPGALEAQDCKAALPSQAVADDAEQGYAAALGCTDAATEAGCLRQLTTAQAASVVGLGYQLGGQGTVGPIINGTTLPRTLRQALRTGQVNKVPVIAGTDRDEDLMGIATSPDAYTSFVERLYGEHANQVLAEYPLSRFGSAAIAFRTIAADSNTVCPALQTDADLARWMPVHGYEIDDNDAPPYEPVQADGQAYGASHVAAWWLLPASNLDADQQALQDEELASVGGFAATGDPSAAGTPPWPTYNGSHEIMSLEPAGDSELVTTTELAAQHDCAFWDKLAPHDWQEPARPTAASPSTVEVSVTESDPSTQQPGGWRRRTMLGGLLVGAGGLAAAGTALPALAQQRAHHPKPRSPFPPGAAVATSPDGHAAIGLWADQTGPHWAATYRGVTIAGPSALGLVLADGTVLGPHAGDGYEPTTRHHGTWHPPYGRNATVDDSWTQVRMLLTDSATGIAFAVAARAYDGGVALRYEVTDAPGGSVELSGEATTVVLPAGSIVYGSRDEDPFLAVAPASIPSSGTSTTDTGPLFDNPVTAVLPDGTLVCVCEADRQHYPRLMLAGGNGNALGTHLMQFAGRGGTDGPVDTFTVPVGFSTPWRVLVTGADGPDLIDHSDLVPTLATPNAIGDTSWLRPGKALRVTSLNTQAALDGIDFAVARKLSYIEFDAGWYGPENDPTSDPTKPIAALDMPQIIAYGQSKGVGLVLYVNRIALSDPDSLFALYRSWGVAGLKLGFVLEGTQAETDQVIGFATTAAKYHLMVNQHDDLRPFGQDRTWPNWINLEGVRGNEHFPTAGHNVTLPFTRNVAGPMDYTICLSQSKDQTTDAHQMAMAVVFYQPIVWDYWYDSPSKYATGSWPQLPWFDAVPSVWDESRALAGAIGEYAVVARRSGGSWFLGAMTNEQGRTLQVPLGFLGGGSWQATVWADGTPNSSPYLTPVVQSTNTVTARTTLAMTLAPSGGQAVLLQPA